ncbi:MAG: hypothetical protein SOX17_06345 [Prevotella sp.]|nr:hypothetical protein [Prevotella sp.]
MAKTKKHPFFLCIVFGLHYLSRRQAAPQQWQRRKNIRFFFALSSACTTFAKSRDGRAIPADNDTYR